MQYIQQGSQSLFRKSRPQLFIVFIIVTLLSMLAAGCAPATQSPVAGSEAAQELITVKVGASPLPHGDILRFIQDNLAADAGLNIEIIEFTDYVQPNLALADGTLDANFFQHLPYLNDFNAEHNLEIVSVADVHIEPLGVYSRKLSSLDAIPDGGTIAIPNDATNGGRALNLLQSNGLLTLTEGAGSASTVQDIIDNPLNLEIKELEAAQLARALDDVDAAVINGNFAIEAGLTPATDAIVLESGIDNPYANILAVNKGHENDEGILKLVKLLTSPEVRKFIEETYNGSVIPAF